jgi:hypothetical protein
LKTLTFDQLLKLFAETVVSTTESISHFFRKEMEGNIEYKEDGFWHYNGKIYDEYELITLIESSFADAISKTLVRLCFDWTSFDVRYDNNELFVIK